MILMRVIRRFDSGYFDIEYSAQKSGSNTIGSYTLMCKPDGTPYGANRDYHRKLVGDGTIYLNECLNQCKFHGRALAGCDGSSLVMVYENEKDRWNEAITMAEVN